MLVENSGSGLHAQVSAVRLDAAAGGTPVKAEVVFTNRQKGGGAHSGGQKAEGQGAAEAKAALPSMAAAAPQTGDAAFGAAAWACLTAGALAGAAVLLRRRKEK